MSSKMKTFHATNPSDMEKWSRMSDAADWYVILHPGVTTIASVRNYQVKYREEMVTRHEGKPGGILYQGSCVPAKAFGPGVDLQRLVDLGAIRQATPWEEDEVLRDFSGKAGRTEAPVAESYVGEDEPPVNEPKAVNDARVERAEKNAKFVSK